jgi:hypothetical protein
MMYLVRRANAIAALDDVSIADWTSPVWQHADVLHVDQFRPESSAHHPMTQAKLLHDNTSIHVLFCVQDNYIRSIQTEYQSPVSTDSCVEWFAQPRSDRGYINFEVNCGGTLHSSYIEDPTRVPGGFKRFTYLPVDLAAQIHIQHSMPAVVEPEIAVPTTWLVYYRVPVTLFEWYAGKLGRLSGQTWQSNFFKCADHTSHPHWAAWSPVQELNFHRPQDFAPIGFE